MESLFDLSTTDGLNVITTYFVGQFVAQFITILLLKVIKPEKLSIYCSIIMIISSLLLVSTLFIETNNMYRWGWIWEKS